MHRCFIFLLALLVLLKSPDTNAQTPSPSFDLTGPKVDVHVKRGEVTLPIGQVPNLMAGDRLWVHPDLPSTQSARYVLVVAFLRGVTNPPPPEWFTRVETWTKEARSEGIFVTVPAEAQQAVLFLAPETGGDFSTLRNTVRGRPGIFVRATQDLQSASADRMRLDTYLTEVKVTSQSDPKSLKDRAERAARSLGIRLDQQCFDKPTDQQAPCLAQHTNGLVMDDSNVSSRVAQLTSGSSGDLMNALAYSPIVGAGGFSPYIGAIVDTARLLASLHTAHYQYIPALALPTNDTLNLRLNTAPSFRDPKSVVVVALPPVGPAKMPPLHPSNPTEQFCAQRPGLVLPAEGAPLIHATELAYNLMLHIESKAGAIDVPVRAEPSQGGLVVTGPVPPLPAGEMTGVIRGKWGFDDWEGPHFRLRSAGNGKWSVAPGDQSALVVGRQDTLHIEGDSTLCVESVRAQLPAGAGQDLVWKSAKPELLELAVPLKDAAPGPVTVEIKQFGLENPDKLTLKAYSEAAALERLTLSSGDAQAVLTGTRLDEVSKASLNSVVWTPTGLKRVQDIDRLELVTENPTSHLEPGKRYVAKVELRDGRELKAPVTIEQPRPEITILSKGTQDEASGDPSPVRLGSSEDLPVERRLVFFLKSKKPASFPRDQKIEVAAVDDSFRTVLSLSDGTLMLEDASTALGVVEPLNRFGLSAFGPLQARAVTADGVKGEWLPLGTLVRVPGFKELHCPRAASKPCTLTGSNLFLAASIGSTPEFENSTDVPPDFTGTQLSVPRPVNGLLYLRLRDDPATVQTLSLAVTPATAAGAIPAAARSSNAPAATELQASPAAATQAPATKPEP